MRATILLMAMLATGISQAQTLPEAEKVVIPGTPSSDAAPASSLETAAAPEASPVAAADAPAACACPAVIEGTPIDLGSAPEPSSVVTIAPTSTTSGSTGFGSVARSWVDLQVSGSAASVTARPLPGDAATNAYDRYANSFKQPIPESFERESFSSEGGGN
ncbi:DUF3613 domain-containing protein [Nevskia sp.]|uniref:DUF3613 domain-containing protein n=1 Tax=Nevskia sp. TaxID=1929292 RepID=UPI0025F90AE6|nr:DUF3613 domain-containing protein [Nevskia sp.]